MSSAKSTKKKMDDYAYESIRTMIIKCELKPGQPIGEQSLSEMLRISRTPVRTALRRLASERLVDIKPDRGSNVANVSIDDANEIFEFRILLELESLKHFIAKVSDAEIDRYISKFNEYDNMKIFSNRYHELDEDFHISIVKSSDNSRIIATYTTLLTEQMRYRIIASLDPNRIKSTSKEHIAILNAIKTREYRCAARALSNHLLSVKNSIWISLNDYYWTIEKTEDQNEKVHI